MKTAMIFRKELGKEGGAEGWGPSCVWSNER